MWQQQNLISKLYAIGAIKFGSFPQKSGQTSPLYIDLRLTVSYPEILQLVSECIWEKIKHHSFDLICGVPYAALPIATTISVENKIPMILRRKEAKDYGSKKKSIEGFYQAGQSCLIIEDVVTSGLSIEETIEQLEQEQLTVQDIAVLIDREQGAKQILGKKGYHLHSVFTLSHIIESLERSEKIDRETSIKTLAFIRDNQVLETGRV